MLSKAFKVVEPNRFDLYIEDVCLNGEEVLVKVDYAAICKADLRYYKGLRELKVLSLKYPMSLLHEATGIVLKDPTNTFLPGARVVFIPNETDYQCDEKCVCQESSLGGNYCPKAKFASSNVDGFSKEFVKTQHKQLVLIEDNIDSNVAVFSEMISVACAAMRRVSDFSGTIGVIGDGILGYILAAAIKTLYPESRIVVIGKHGEKLEMFYADKAYVIGDPINEAFDLVFESVGGDKSAAAINQAIDLLRVSGKLVLTGVSENNIPINTRKILEKGIWITGSTRSQRADFEQAQQLLRNNTFYELIKQLNLSEQIIENITDYYTVFELESQNKRLGKYLMQFKL